MPKYNVPLTSHASITVEVETDENDPRKIAELAQESEWGGASLCHQCAGSGNNGLDLGDEWEPYLVDGVPEVYRTD